MTHRIWGVIFGLVFVTGATIAALTVGIGVFATVSYLV